MKEEININFDDLNEQTIRQNFFSNYFDLIQFNYIFDRFELSKDFLREMIGKLNHCQLLEFHSDILTSAKIIRVLSIAYLINAITFLKYCKINYWKDQFAYYNAIDKFEYRLNWSERSTEFLRGRYNEN